MLCGLIVYTSFVLIRLLPWAPPQDNFVSVKEYKIIMQPNNSPKNLHPCFADNDPRANMGLECEENYFGHSISPKLVLSPEEAAGVIWEQWNLIRTLVAPNSI